MLAFQLYGFLFSDFIFMDVSLIGVYNFQQRNPNKNISPENFNMLVQKSSRKLTFIYLVHSQTN